MLDTSTITLPKSMSLSDRIIEVSKQISVWLDSLETPFNVNTDALELTNYKQNDQSYSYQYSVDRDVRNPKGRSPYQSLI